MALIRSLFVCTSAVTLSALLAGCGSTPMPGVNASLRPFAPASSADAYGAEHLFAIGQDSGNLYVFDVNRTTGVATPAPGSPTTVPPYSYLAVQALP